MKAQLNGQTHGTSYKTIFMFENKNDGSPTVSGLRNSVMQQNRKVQQSHFRIPLRIVPRVNINIAEQIRLSYDFWAKECPVAFIKQNNTLRKIADSQCWHASAINSLQPTKRSSTYNWRTRQSSLIFLRKVDFGC